MCPALQVNSVTEYNESQNSRGPYCSPDCLPTSTSTKESNFFNERSLAF